MAKRYIIGVDEVGRGPLAGPITVAAVVVSLWQTQRKLFRGMRDSKKLSARQREKWHRKLTPSLLTVAASVGPKMIDKIGISAAARLAVGRCLKKIKKEHEVSMKNCSILLDGSLYAPRTYQTQKTIIKGDEKVPVIAAASIIAKVTRDRHMIRLHKKFPSFGFHLHKGYGTVSHYLAIKKHGISPVHRRSFCHFV